MEDRPRILLADDDPHARDLLRVHLEDAGFEVVEAADGKEAIDAISDELSLAMFDLRMPRATGLECLAVARRRAPVLPVMVISGEGDVADAVAAMKQGAFDYVTKPFDPDELLARVREAVRASSLARENAELRAAVSEPAPAPGLVASDPATKEMLRRAERAAQIDSTVLITGPSGAGKSMLARAIHAMSARAGGPFVSVSCAALPRELVEAELFGHERGAFTGAVASRPGRVEMADGGTLFLDEIGDLPLELQPKLLNFLQDRVVQRVGATRDRGVEVRVIAATNQDLEVMARDGRFREDLLYRLNVIRLDVPSLRDRPGEIIPLAEDILARIAHRRGASPFRLSEGARGALRGFAYPGNVRQLENILERATAFLDGDEIGEADLNLPGAAMAGRGDDARAAGGDLPALPLKELERLAIIQALERNEGNRARAARDLGVSEKTIYNKIRQFDLSGKV